MFLLGRTRSIPLGLVFRLFLFVSQQSNTLFGKQLKETTSRLIHQRIIVSVLKHFLTFVILSQSNHQTNLKINGIKITISSCLLNKLLTNLLGRLTEYNFFTLVFNLTSFVLYRTTDCNITNTHSFAPPNVIKK